MSSVVCSGREAAAAKILVSRAGNESKRLEPHSDNPEVPARLHKGNTLSSPGLGWGRGAAPRRPSPRPPRRSRYSRRRAKGGGGDPPPARRAKQEAKRQRSQRSRGRPSEARLRCGGRRNYAARAKRGPLRGRRGTPRRAAAVFRPLHGGNGGPPPLASAVEGARRRRGGCERSSSRGRARRPSPSALGVRCAGASSSSCAGRGCTSAAAAVRGRARCSLRARDGVGDRRRIQVVFFVRVRAAEAQESVCGCGRVLERACC